MASGKFNTECPCEGESMADCPIGDCECENQLRVNHDCSVARWVFFFSFLTRCLNQIGMHCVIFIFTMGRFCKSNSDPNDFDEIDCSHDPDNHVVMVNLVYHTWYCGNVSHHLYSHFDWGYLLYSW